MFRNATRSNFGAIDVTLRVHCQAFAAAGSLQFQRILNAVKNFSVFDSSDANPSLPSGMRRHAIRFGMRHVDQIVSDVNAAGATELLPFSEISA